MSKRYALVNKKTNLVENVVLVHDQAKLPAAPRDGVADEHSHLRFDHGSDHHLVESETAEIGHVHKKGQFHAPEQEALPKEEKEAQLRAEARIALMQSDTVVVRCFENNVPFPVEWKRYRATLRVIASTGSGFIPKKPTFPPGT